MGAFRLIIGCNFEQYGTLGGSFTPNRYLILDNIDDRQVQSSAKIASQPMQSGDTISDHMYREPDVYTVSGIFSLNGMNWNDNSYNFIQSGDRLTNIQNAFETIKDQGLLCTLITLNTDALPGYSNSSTRDNLNNNEIVAASVRFKIRKNMALQSITWTEMQNSLKFTFQFHQIIMVEQQEYENLEEAERMNLGLPNVANPVGSSLGTVMADNGLLQRTVIQTLAENKYIKDDFWGPCLEILRDIGTIIIVEAVLAVATLVLAGTIYFISVVGVGAALTSSVAAVFPVGTIVAAAVVIVAAIAAGIAAIFKRTEQNRKDRIAFKLVNGSAEQDTNRLTNLLDDIEVEVNKVNSNVTIYEIQQNVEHQVILNIAGEYYCINFEQDNVNGYNWRAQVTSLDGEPLATVQKDKWCPVYSFLDMDRNQNLWFKDKTKQYEVYLMNPSLAPDYNSEDEPLEVVRKKLTSYTIWVSRGNIEDNIERIQNAIKKAIQNQGFK